MDLEFSASDTAFRLEVRAFLNERMPRTPMQSIGTADGFEMHREWERTLATERLSAVAWPEHLGGRDASLTEWVIFEEEYYAAGAPTRVSQNGIYLLAPTIFAHGTPEQIGRVLPAMARGDVIWAQAWSEPEAGSDLAGIRARAKRVPDGWLLSGQKTWSTRATFADRAFGLFRTDPDGERHSGLTYFMFDLKAPGVEVRGIRDLTGLPGFAEIFLDDVFVPDEDVIGEPNQGWRVAMSTAANERGLTLRSPGRFLASADRLLDLHESAGSDHLTKEVVDAWIGARAYQLHTWRTVTKLRRGGELGAESSIGKLHWSDLDIRIHELALDLLGATSEVAGEWTDGYIFSLAGPIYAGTNEIQRNIVGERLLGLPR
jgi:alkylation response protein AidB-like acyl-CoA dehydrogenase